MILDGTNKDNIRKAVELIKGGEVVAFPTETVYGLGADAFNESAVKQIFKIKGRPFEDPLILHVADESQLRSIAQDIPPLAFKLIEKFWPGPLTLVLKKTPQVSNLLTAGLETVAVRMPRNIIALALIKNSRSILAAPSANKFQSLSPTTAQAVEKELGENVKLILDGGPCLVGLESTIIDLSKGSVPRVLRWGGISKEQLDEVLGMDVKLVTNEPFARSITDQNVDSKSASPLTLPEGCDPQMAPGMLEFHYAPRTPLKLVTEHELATTFKQGLRSEDHWLCFSNKEKLKLEGFGASNIHVLSGAGNLDEAARNYFDILRKLDSNVTGLILALEMPQVGLGRALNDRLRKAQHN